MLIMHVHVKISKTFHGPLFERVTLGMGRVTFSTLSSCLWTLGLLDLSHVVPPFALLAFAHVLDGSLAMVLGGRRIKKEI